MKVCASHDKIQDYLDGLLPQGDAATFAAHVEGCASCALELAIYRRVIARVSALQDFELDPTLTEHIVERILPSRARRRRIMRALGIGYAAAFAALVGAAGMWIVQPGSMELVNSWSARASGAVVQSMVMALDAVGFMLASLAQGRGLIDALGLKLAPLARVVPAVLQQPVLAALMIAAIAACAWMLVWMRPRDFRSRDRGGRHVAILGF